MAFVHRSWIGEAKLDQDMSTLAKKRSEALKKLTQLVADKRRVLLIHYASEDFANRPDGTSARVTSIAVRNLDSAQTESFSIHQCAERLRVPSADVKAKIQELENELLSQFNSFMTKHHGGYTWVHWNMRDSNYGFPAIYHRCRTQGIDPNELDPASLFDLSRCLVDIYGPNYIEHPRLPSLMARNQITDLGFLSGPEEVDAAARGDFVSVHRSTLRKVDTFEAIISKANAGTLVTNYRWRDIYGSSPKDLVIFLKEHWVYSLLGIITLVIGLIAKFASLFGSNAQP